MPRQPQLLRKRLAPSPLKHELGAKAPAPIAIRSPAFPIPRAHRFDASSHLGTHRSSAPRGKPGLAYLAARRRVALCCESIARLRGLIAVQLGDFKSRSVGKFRTTGCQSVTKRPAPKCGIVGEWHGTPPVSRNFSGAQAHARNLAHLLTGNASVKE